MTLEFPTHVDSEESKAETLARIKKNLEKTGMEYLYSIAEEMAESPYALELMRLGGLNGPLTDAMFQNMEGQPGAKASENPADQRLITSPLVQAVRHRFQAFQAFMHRLLHSGAIPPTGTIASVPCGYMRELLTLDFTDCQPRIIGIDKDPTALSGGKRLAKALGLNNVDFFHKNALALGAIESIDAIVSNGLNIYLSDKEVLQLYQQAFGSLKSGGYFITSHLTPEEDWNFSQIDEQELEVERNFLQHIVGARWLPFHRHHTTTKRQLEGIGFEVMDITFDPACRFPVFLTRKP